MEEIKDIAMWEETDSELAKYTIQQLNGDNMHLKTYLKNIEQVNKKLYERIDKAIEYIHNNQLVFELFSKEQIQEWFDKFYVELLNILRGDYNEKE